MMPASTRKKLGKTNANGAAITGQGAVSIYYAIESELYEWLRKCSDTGDDGYPPVRLRIVSTRFDSKTGQPVVHAFEGEVTSIGGFYTPGWRVKNAAPTGKWDRVFNVQKVRDDATGWFLRVELGGGWPDEVRSTYPAKISSIEVL